MIYLQQTLMYSLKVIDKPHKSSMLEFLQELQQAFEYILAAWDLITNNTTNGVWGECIHDFKGFKKQSSIVILEQTVAFDELEKIL